MTALSLSYPWLPADDAYPVACCMCGGAGANEEVFAFTLNGKVFSILRCTKDDLMYLSPQPGARYVDALYNHPSYFTELNDMYGHFVDEEKGRATGTLRADELRDNGGLPKNFLEIGCGLGYTLEAMQEAGVDAVGVEFAEELAAKDRARGLSVYRADLDDLTPAEVLAKAPYEAIAMYSVLEHVPNPSVFLDHLLPHLAPSGRLVIRVPEMSKSGPWISLLDHYWHFTPSSIEALLTSKGLAILTRFASGTFLAPDGQKLPSMTIIATRA